MSTGFKLQDVLNITSEREAGRTQSSAFVTLEGVSYLVDTGFWW